MSRVGLRVATRCCPARVEAFGKVGADLPRQIGFDRARVSLFISDAKLAQRLDNGARWHLEFAREFIYANRTHSITGF
jgi:hypothetical protein